MKLKHSKPPSPKLGDDRSNECMKLAMLVICPGLLLSLPFFFPFFLFLFSSSFFRHLPPTTRIQDKQVEQVYLPSQNVETDTQRQLYM